jgi:hypothetical protein
MQCPRKQNHQLHRQLRVEGNNKQKVGRKEGTKQERKEGRVVRQKDEIHGAIFWVVTPSVMWEDTNIWEDLVAPILRVK